MSDARMRERRGDSCNFYSWKKEALACNCGGFIRDVPLRESPPWEDWSELVLPQSKGL